MADKPHQSGGGGLFGKYINSAMNTISRVPAVDQLQHTLRQQVAMHNPHQNAETLKIQLAIKASKGVVSDAEALGRETKVYSKNLYLWGKDEKGADIVDLTDRLAYLVFQSAEIHEQQAQRLAQSRQALKDIRNFENDLVPKRQKRQAHATKLAQLKQAHPNASADISRMTAELEQMENEDATFESSLEVLKRQKIHEAFALHWSAQRELGEKLAIVAGYGDILLQAMDSAGFADQYTGQETTAEVRVETAEALANWSAASPLIPAAKLKSSGGSFLNRNDSKSFGQTHAAQLSQVGGLNPFSSSSHPPPESSPALADAGHSGGTSPLPTPGYAVYNPQGNATAASVPVNSAARPVPPPPAPPHPDAGSSPEGIPSINLSPTLAPTGAATLTSSSPPQAALRDPHQISSSSPDPVNDGVPTGPTVAETGPPVVGGGPKSGQLRPRRPSASEPTPLASLGSNDGLDLQRITKAQEADAERRASVSSGSSNLDRMSTTSRRRLERSEEDMEGGEMPPAYGEMETPEQRANREAEAILARERENKRTA